MISGLTRVTTISGGDSIPLGVSSQGDDRATSVTDLLAYMQANLTFPTLTGTPNFVTQYAVPNANPFSVSISNTTPGTNIFLICAPTGVFAIGGIVLPPIIDTIDKQEVMIHCTQTVTAFTLGGNGALMSGEPVAGAPLPAMTGFRMRYDLNLTTWYRVG